MASYSPNELAYLRQYRTGVQPDLALLEEPDPEMAELYAPMAANDPSAGIDPMATAMGGGAGGTPGVNEGSTGPGNVPASDVSAPVPGAGGTLGMPPANMSGANMVPNLPASEPHPGVISQPVVGPSPAQAREEAAAAAPAPPIPETTITARPGARGFGAGAINRIPYWEEMYSKQIDPATGQPRDPKFAPLGIPVTPQEADQMAFRAQQMGNLSVEQAEQSVETGRQVAAAEANTTAMKAGYQAEVARRDKERTDTVAKMEANMRSLFDEAGKEPIDSERHWDNKSTGEQILSRIAVALGAFGAAMTGAPNYAFEKLQSDINRDIEAQKQNKAFKQSRAVAEGSLIQLARDRFDDEHLQDLAMQQAAWNMVDGELTKFSSMVKLPQQQTAIEQMRTQVQGQQEELGTQFRTALDAYALQRIAARQAALAAGQKKPKKTPRGELKDILGKINTQDALIGKLRRAKDLTSSWLDRVPGAKEKASAETLMTSALFDIKNAAQLGALSESDQGLIQDYLGDPTALFRSAGSEAKIDQAIQIAEAAKAQALRQHQDLQSADTAPDRGPPKGEK